MPSLRRAVVAAIVLGAAGSLAAPALAAPPPPSLSSSVVGESPNGGGVFRFVQAVAFTPGGGTVFTGDQYSGVVQAFGRDGSYHFSIGERASRREPGRLGIVGGVATDHSGHVYVLDSENDRVQVFGAGDGHFVSSFGDASIFDLSANDPANGAGISASGLAVYQPTSSSPPIVYVADQGRNRVARFTLDLATMKPTGSPLFSDPGLGLKAPQGIAVDAAGTRVYVADDQNDRIAVLDPQSLVLTAQIAGTGGGPGQFQAPYDVAVDSHQPQRLYVADNQNNRVDVFDAQSLGFLGTLGNFGRTPGLFSIVRAVGGLSDDPDGGVAVADTANNRIQTFAADGTLTAAWGIAGRSAGYFTRPRGVAFAPDGGIAVADSFNYRIARFDSDGTFSGQLGLVSTFTGYPSEGSDPGQFSLPAAVTFDAAGDTVVADKGNDRVVVLAPDGTVLRTTPAGQLADPQAVAPGPSGSVLVADSANNRIVTLASDGSLASQRTGLAHPTAVAWDGGSKILATDDTRVRDVISGTNVAPPPGESAWDHPDGLAIDPIAGTLYVSELRPGTADGARVLRGTPASGGSYDWDTIATEGSGTGEVIEPGGLALSPDGATLLVVDTGNDRVLRFDAAGHTPPATARLSVVLDDIRRGTVTSNPLGIGCATDCMQHYGSGRAVTLTATPVAGSLFAGWAGACTGGAPTCTVTMNGDQAVSASFTAAPAAPPPPQTQPPPAPPAPPPAPVAISKLRIAPATLHRARKADRRAHRRARKATRAKVSLTLSRPATLTVTLQVPHRGVKRGSRCLAPPRKRSKHDHSCTRYLPRAGSRKVKLNSGRRSFTLTPTFASHLLPIGRYRLSLTALDANANRVGPLTAAIRIAR